MKNICTWNTFWETCKSYFSLNKQQSLSLSSGSNTSRVIVSSGQNCESSNIKNALTYWRGQRGFPAKTNFFLYTFQRVHYKTHIFSIRDELFSEFRL